MNLSGLARATGKTAVYMRDINALQRGRLPQRLANRLTGRVLSWIGRRLWR